MPDISAPEIVLIAAMTRSDRVIGCNGKLPWPPIPEDMERFKTRTLGHPVLMGGRTWREDLNQVPLPGRIHIVVSTQAVQVAEAKPEPIAFTSLEKALEWIHQQPWPRVYILGGGSIYTQTLPQADTLDLTLIEADYKGDIFFQRMNI
ncbi:MAG: dihydrofolate reductase [Synechococcaceae cyanobacterium RM1_1_27]|nr:dihydrofolate reductase [Synechococcaceae cyanobacterium RM1_1_27]